MILYAATTNAGKLREFAACAQGELIAGGPLEVLALPRIEALAAPAEDAPTFMGNAELKARAYSQAMLNADRPGLLVLADDSGLEVDALGGEPGVRSARWAEDAGYWPAGNAPDAARANRGPEAAQGPGLSPAQRNGALLMDRMARLAALRPDLDRRARFIGALALARDGQILLTAEGVVEGEIVSEARGAGGFGYDPYFLVPRFGKTLAELSPEQKWSVSHRGEAFRKLVRKLAGGFPRLP